MTVGELKKYLDDYGDHLSVLVSDNGGLSFEVPSPITEVMTGSDEDGMAAVIILVDAP